MIPPSDSTTLNSPSRVINRRGAVEKLVIPSAASRSIFGTIEAVRPPWRTENTYGGRPVLTSLPDFGAASPFRNGTREPGLVPWSVAASTGVKRTNRFGSHPVGHRYVGSPGAEERHDDRDGG